jgi:hypothetical protein
LHPARHNTITPTASLKENQLRLSKLPLPKLSLLGAAAALALSSLAAHADSLSLGNAGQSLSFIFNGDHETGSGGNVTPSSAVIGGKTVDFSAVYCVDLYDFINDNTVYNNTLFTTNGQVNGSAVHNAAKIAWLILNTTVTNDTEAAGLQAAIWETEYGNDFALLTGGAIAADQAADLSALSHGTVTSSLIARLDWITPPTITIGRAKDEDTIDQQGLVGLPDPSPVPEPGTLSLFGTGILGIAALVRRRTSA